MHETSVTMYMRWYVDDYLNDTDHLSLNQHGAYSLLMMKMWKRDGWLPLDHDQLARLCRVSREEWDTIWPKLEHYFLITEATGFFTQKRLLEELEKAKLRCDVAARSGALGGRTRAANATGHHHPSARSKRPLKARSSAAQATLEATLEQPLSDAQATLQGSLKQTPKQRSSRFQANPDPDPDPEAEEDPDKSGEALRPSPQHAFALHPEETPEPAILTFPIRNSRGGRSTWDLHAHELRLLQDGFPALDVLGQCREALVWAVANPTKRKTGRGMLAFLTRWMGRARDRGVTGNHAPPRAEASRSEATAQGLAAIARLTAANDADARNGS